MAITLNIAITDGSTPLRVLEAEYSEEKLDVMLLVDSSSVGEMTTPLVGPLIERLPEGDQMALVGFDQSAAVEALFREAGAQSVRTVKDLAVRDRVVTGFKNPLETQG